MGLLIGRTGKFHGGGAFPLGCSNRIYEQGGRGHQGEERRKEMISHSWNFQNASQDKVSVRVWKWVRLTGIMNQRKGLHRIDMSLLMSLDSTNVNEHPLWCLTLRSVGRSQCASPVFCKTEAGARSGARTLSSPPAPVSPLSSHPQFSHTRVICRMASGAKEK